MDLASYQITSSQALPIHELCPIVKPRLKDSSLHQNKMFPLSKFLQGANAHVMILICAYLNDTIRIETIIMTASFVIHATLWAIVATLFFLPLAAFKAV